MTYGYTYGYMREDIASVIRVLDNQPNIRVSVN